MSLLIVMPTNQMNHKSNTTSYARNWQAGDGEPEIVRDGVLAGGRVWWEGHGPKVEMGQLRLEIAKRALDGQV